MAKAKSGTAHVQYLATHSCQNAKVLEWGEGGGERQHCWAFGHVWAWEKGIERGREGRVGGEKNGNGGEAGCQGYGPLALGSPGL